MAIQRKINTHFTQSPCCFVSFKYLTKKFAYFILPKNFQDPKLSANSVALTMGYRTVFHQKHYTGDRHVDTIVLSFLIYWNIPLFLFTTFFDDVCIPTVQRLLHRREWVALVERHCEGKMKYLEKNLFQCHFVRQKAYTFLPLLLTLFLLCLFLPLHLLLLFSLPLIILTLPFFFQFFFFFFFFYHSFFFSFFHSFLIFLFFLLLYGATSQNDAVSFYTPKRNLWTGNRTIARPLPTNYNTNKE